MVCPDLSQRQMCPLKAAPNMEQAKLSIAPFEQGTILPRTTDPLGTIPALLVRVAFRYDPSNSEPLKSLLNSHTTVAETRLMLAVLENAIEDFHDYVSAKDRKGKLLYQQAKHWIQARNNEWFLSFDSICASLFVNPDHLRRALLHQSLELARHAPTRH